jgi:hypothetical protein
MVRLGTTLVLAAVVVLTACASVPDQARAEAIDKATADVRNTAVKAQEQLRLGLEPQALAGSLKALSDQFPAESITVFDSAQQPSGSFVASVVIVGNGEAGGGGFYEQVAVRLCVKYTGVNGRGVEMADTNCPSGLPSSVGGVRVVQDVTLGK